MAAGARYAVDHPPEGENPVVHLQNCWLSFYHSPESRGLKDDDYIPCARAFLRSFCQRAGIREWQGVPLPTYRKVGAVVTAMNEEASIGLVLEQLGRMPLAEIIVVVNGSSDQTFSVARQTSPNAIIVHLPDPLGYDVGRAVGARLSRSDILLFLDGDIAIAAEELIPFIRAIDRGADVALNDLSPFLPLFAGRDEVTVVKEFVNRSLGRNDLGANSLTAIPHALSRRALETIGIFRLAVPPVAQAAAIAGGLAITAPASVDVIRTNRLRDINTGHLNPVARLILGDHLEALGEAMGAASARLHFPDGLRKRGKLEGGRPCSPASSSPPTTKSIC